MQLVHLAGGRRIAAGKKLQDVLHGMENAPHRYDGDGSAKNQRRRRGEQAKVQAVCNLAHHSVFRKLFEIDEIPMRRRALGRISAFRCFKQSVLPLWQRGEHRLFLGGIQHPPIRAEKVKIFRQILVRFGAERINIQKQQHHDVAVPVRLEGNRQKIAAGPG